jgi:hypothetical protein
VDQALVEKGAQLRGTFRLIAEESSRDQKEVDQEIQGDRGKGTGIAARRAILQAEKSVG